MKDEWDDVIHEWAVEEICPTSLNPYTSYEKDMVRRYERIARYWLERGLASKKVSP